jgi:nitroreductase
MELYEVIAKRRTVRKFKGPATETQLMRILVAGTKAPSGMNQQRWEFIVVDDPALVEQIAERKYVLNRGNTPRGEEAATPEMEKAAQAQKDSFANGSHVAVYYKEGGRDEAWMCLENMSLAAVAEGLGTRIAFFRAGAEKDIDKILQVPPGYELACVLSIGVPAMEPAAPPLRPEGSWLHRNKF